MIVGLAYAYDGISSSSSSSRALLDAAAQNAAKYNHEVYT